MPTYAPRPSRLYRQMRKSNDPPRRKVLRKSQRKNPLRLPYQMAVAAPFKRTMYARLPYVESLTNMTSGTLGVFGTENVYRLGSIFDPQFAVGGRQPIGRDIFSQIYQKYKVYGVMVDCTWDDAGADGTVGGMLIGASGDTTTLQGLQLEQAIEKPNVFRVYVNDTGSQRQRFRKYFSLGRIDGLTKSQFNNDIQQYCASMTTNPTLTPFLRLAVANISTASGIKVHCDLRLTYYVKFYDPITLPTS